MIDLEWKSRKLGEVITLQRGFDLPKSKRKMGNIPIISSSGTDGYHNESKVKGPGVVTGRYGTLGKVFFTKEDFWPLNTTLYVKDFKGNDPKFISYFLFTLNLANQNTAGAVPGLNRNALHLINVEIPIIYIQKKIASILSTYDDLIENNTRRIEILEQMAKLVYEEWFVKFRFPGHEKVKMISSGLGEIPDGWKVKKLPDLCSKVIDGTHDSPKPSEKGYFLVTGKHIVNGFINFSDCYLISPKEHSKVIQRSKPEKGDIIFSNIGTLGSIALVDQDFEFSIKNVALFKPLENLYSNYLYLYFSLPETYNRMERKASGTSQKFFSLNFLRNLKIVEPPKYLLYKFDNAVKPLIEERSILNKKNQILHKTRDLLLPKLISGEIDVSDLDIRIRNEYQERNFNFGEPQDEKRFRAKMV